MLAAGEMVADGNAKTAQRRVDAQMRAVEEQVVVEIVQHDACRFAIAAPPVEPANAAAAPERRGQIMGVYTAANALGFVLGPAMIALMPDRPAALLLGCAAIALMALIPFAAVERPVSRLVVPGSARHIVSAITAFPLAFGFLFIASMIDAIAISLMPVIMLDRDFDVSQAVRLAAVFHVGLVIGQPLIGLALDKAGRRRTVLGCCGLSLACTLPLVLRTKYGVLARSRADAGLGRRELWALHRWARADR
ncbi:MFS transporter [Mesorhizobium sp.]